jgi:hypothetical protein
MPFQMQDWQADFAVFSADGQLAAIAEAKKKADVGSGWAAAWFRNYLAHQRSLAPPFVILATPEKIYLWKHPNDVSSSEPTALTDARRLFAPYLPPSATNAADLSSRAFEFVVGSWLTDLSQHLWQPSAPEEIDAFRETGLLQAIANGRVVSEIAA